MKPKLFIFAMVCAGLAGCYTVCHKHKIPNNLKPLSKTEYNDVYTVYYNCNQNCSEYPNEYEGDTVKVYGWSSRKIGNSLCDNANGLSYPTIAIDSIYFDYVENYRRKISILGVINNHCPEGAPACFLHIIAIDYYIE
ncbi:MAG: hypothetical protein LBC68_14875 [Prevotellaceae bacterium]|jgi:hypothetical protein|nr:hypothetical protein [Prevotellaceae bacterium]